MIEHEIYQIAQRENGIIQNEKGHFCLGKEGRIAAKDAFDRLLGQAWPEDLLQTRREVKEILQTADSSAVKLVARSFLGRIDFRLREMIFLTQSEAVSPFRSAADIFRATRNFRISELNPEELTRKLGQRGLLRESLLRPDFSELEQRIMAANEERRARLAAYGFHSSERPRLNRRIIGIATVILVAFLGVAGFTYSRHFRLPDLSVDLTEWRTKFAPSPSVTPETGAESDYMDEKKGKMDLKAGEEIVLKGQLLDGLGYKFQAVAPRPNGKFAVNEIALGGDSLAGEGLTVLALHSGDYYLDGQKITLPGGVLLANARCSTDTLTLQKDDQKAVFAYFGRLTLPKESSLIISQELTRCGLNLTDGKYLAIVTCDHWDETAKAFLMKTVLIFKQLPPSGVK